MDRVADGSTSTRVVACATRIDGLRRRRSRSGSGWDLSLSADKSRRDGSEPSSTGLRRARSTGSARVPSPSSNDALAETPARIRASPAWIHRRSTQVSLHHQGPPVWHGARHVRPSSSAQGRTKDSRVVRSRMPYRIADAKKCSQTRLPLGVIHATSHSPRMPKRRSGPRRH
jgi:hypothetical protein